MPDILVRGLSSAAVAQIDAAAAAAKLSRNEYLRRSLEQRVRPDRDAEVTVADLRRAASAAKDLLDDTVMQAAWR